MTKKNLISIAVHLSIVTISYVILYQLGIFKVKPNNTNLLNWDAKFYNEIRELGYIYLPRKGTNLAFFPLFSMFWKLLAVSPILISIINVVILLAALLVLVREEALDFKLLLFIISFPSMIFFAVPYTESMFFVFGVLILLGYKSKNRLLLYLGFFGASMVRSVSILFLPAIVICEFFNASNNNSISKNIINVIYSFSFCITGLLLSMSIQLMQSGKWFYFIEIQKYWGRRWVIPRFPLTTTSPGRLMGVDAIAFIIGLLGIVVFLKWLSQKLYLSKIKFAIDNSILFSVIFLGTTMFLDTCFTTMNAGEGANIWSLNRHLMATPFAVVFIIWLAKGKLKHEDEWMFFSVFLLFGFYLTGVYIFPLMSIQYFCFFLMMMIFRYVPRFINSFFIFYLFQTWIQIHFYYIFLAGFWVG